MFDIDLINPLSCLTTKIKSYGEIMKISCRKKIAIHSRKDAILIPIHKNIDSLSAITGDEINDELQLLLQSDYFNFEDKEIKSIYAEIDGKLKKVYVMHIPKEQEYNKEYMELGARFAKTLMADKISSFSLVAFEDIYDEKKDFSSTQGFIEGLMFGLYSFDKFKTKKSTDQISEVEIITAQTKLKRFIDETSDEWNATFECINLVKDMVNTPANFMTPEIFADTVKETLPENLEATILDESEIKAQGLNLVHSVGAASKNPPRFIQLSYKGDPEVDTNIALVGKGITFDTGGTNLKPSGSIEAMKTDMAGAATVYGATKLAAMLGLKVNINAYIPLAENTIGADAILPGDVITSASGKTVEIMNTDAEGRLILADALHIATKTDPEVIVDVATLTGACVVALGPFCAGLFSNRRFLSKQLSDISYNVSEDIWELPIYEGYEKGIQSPVADIQNMSTFRREGGAIHAAIFLKEFVDNYPWIHLDIAGPGYLETNHPIFGKNASGFGVRLLVSFIKAHYTGAKKNA